jgi:aminomethyltransferase
MKRTPLHAEHLAAGARMVDFAGWEMPVQYRSIVEEHRAVRDGAGLFDVSHMGEVELSGPGAEQACARLFTNDARVLEPGQAQYTLIANEQGGVVDDVIVYRLEASRFLVCVNAANTDKDVAWIERHGRGLCTIEDASARYALIAIQGPAAASIMGGLAPAAAGLARFRCGRVAVATADAEVEAFAARTGYTGEDGFELFVEPGRAVGVWRALCAAGAVPAGLGARDTLRLEAGLPLYGHELGDDVSPYEVGLGWAVKLNRADMVGHDALERAKREGVPRRLIGLEVDGGIARAGCVVLASGREIGNVTSGSHCPTMGKPLALALVGRGESLDDLAVRIRGKLRGARVTAVPFYVRHA